jgi:ABC-2 type transport system permease protein
VNRGEPEGGGPLGAGSAGGGRLRPGSTGGGSNGAGLIALRARALRNAVRVAPLRYAVGLVLLAAVGWGIQRATLLGVRFVDGVPGIGTIADPALQRSLEALVTLLLLAVAFSVLTTAITTLYASDDLAFLLALPVAATRVFGLKVAETYLSSALVPALLTVPVLVGLGLARDAPPPYYPLALVAVLALFAVPVTLGSLAALVLMRVAPAGRVKEAATALSVLLAAGLILGLRALRPEQLAELTPEEFEQFLTTFADLGVGWLPTGWASNAIWQALDGAWWSPALALLVAVALAGLWLVGRLAAVAYHEGWVRGLDHHRRRLDIRSRPAAAWERPLARLGPLGAVLVKDVRVLLRDPTQWSQLLVLVALAGVYLVSTASVAVEGQRFRDALGTLNVAFLGFLLAGVGVRLAFPLVSLEGEGWWLLRTGPIRTRGLVLGKFLHALPALLLLGLGLGAAQALLLDVTRVLATASLIAGACAAVAVAGIGVGLGAAYPRFAATNPAEIPMSPGGLLYMTLALSYAAALTTLLAYPAWTAIVDPGTAVWGSPAGRLVLLLTVSLTGLVAGGALAFGTWRLHGLESGRE